MNLISGGIFLTCCFVAAVSGYARCGEGRWVDTTCVKLWKCWQYSQLLGELLKKDPNAHSSFMEKHLRPAMCGFEGFEAKVCCPGIGIKKSNPKANCGGIIWHKSLTPDGTPVELEEFPWLALLEYKTANGKIFGCGGVLISDRHVLTAAHCLGMSGNELIGVRLGEHDLRREQDCLFDPYSTYCSPKPIYVGIEQEIPHESYSFLRGPSDFDPLTYDIAVLKLNRSVTTNIIKPICLPDAREDQFYELKVDIFGKHLSAGWGISNNYPKFYVKLMSRLKGIYKSICEVLYGRTLNEDIVCALSKTPETACLADSGGPLMSFNKNSRLMVTGIFAPVDNQACWKPGMPSTFIDVRKYVDWIHSKIDY